MLATDGMGTPTRRFIPPRHARFPTANGSIFLDRYNIKEFRTCWRHGIDTRDHHYDVYLSYNYPGSDDIENIVRHCAIGCGIVTLIAAIIAGGTTASAAINAFVACVTGCVQSQVSNSFSCDIDVVDVGSGDWSGH
ncbi:MAG: hypothetical protein DWH91_04370 [Planctomycetota bacterium]|nr:MAG: hypothetical protein DWH91_04370 [Planctomycetota bacterium]